MSPNKKPGSEKSRFLSARSAIDHDTAERGVPFVGSIVLLGYCQSRTYRINSGRTMALEGCLIPNAAKYWSNVMSTMFARKRAL